MHSARDCVAPPLVLIYESRNAYPVVSHFYFNSPSAATVEIIDTTQPEGIIIDPAEGVALEI